MGTEYEYLDWSPPDSPNPDGESTAPTTLRAASPTPSKPKLAARVYALETELEGLQSHSHEQETKIEELESQLTWACNEVNFHEDNYQFVKTKLDDCITRNCETQNQLDNKTLEYDFLDKTHAQSKDQLESLRCEHTTLQELAKDLKDQVSARDRQIEHLINLLRSKTREAHVNDTALLSCYRHLPSTSEQETLDRLIKKCSEYIRPQLIDRKLNQLLKDVDGLPPRNITDTDTSTSSPSKRRKGSILFSSSASHTKSH